MTMDGVICMDSYSRGRGQILATVSGPGGEECHPLLALDFGMGAMCGSERGSAL